LSSLLSQWTVDQRETCSAASQLAKVSIRYMRYMRYICIYVYTTTYTYMDCYKLYLI